MIRSAIARRASDIHVDPMRDGFQIKFRVDGVLEEIAAHDEASGRGIVSRVMVMAHLLTYRLDIPQEGKAEAQGVDLRISVMPTTHGMRAAIRLPAELVQPKTLEELGLPARVLDGLKQFAAGDAGMLVISGPAGAGKTTTIYALLDYIARSSPGVSIIALEDPVERDLAGVTQIEVSPFGELTYERALRSILRQDPQVLMLGEIRDSATATLAVQAALSGHRLICTLHAGTPGGAVARLVEMGMEPYQISSAIFGVVSQRLLRRKHGTGYSGRVPVAEIAMMDAKLRQAILGRGDRDAVQEAIASQEHFVGIRAAAEELIVAGITDGDEVRRVLGERTGG